ncbi:hypothetical protein AI2618V1_3385 [Serratia marcescens]|uniref:hypothetical protein n=1 Tax=Serratia TaxID=613 RepID=UPI000A8CDBB2|nr:MULTISPECIES: hypothetical protein [Serratia]EGT3596293.1 hypothetical protein [Serratia marcescens]MDP8626442.1 hypothetical protein [Serratia marcescens]MDP8675876.1 hypothetical protein [Serratia marcescens]MDP8690879.1 hypothetical protein [Serratia marcescens]MDP8700537.1 hypothetical protein [Serratia marcescens]
MTTIHLSIHPSSTKQKTDEFVNAIKKELSEYHVMFSFEDVIIKGENYPMVVKDIVAPGDVYDDIEQRIAKVRASLIA